MKVLMVHHSGFFQLEVWEKLEWIVCLLGTMIGTSWLMLESCFRSRFHELYPNCCIPIGYFVFLSWIFFEYWCCYLLFYLFVISFSCYLNHENNVDIIFTSTAIFSGFPPFHVPISLTRFTNVSHGKTFCCWCYGFSLFVIVLYVNFILLLSWIIISTIGFCHFLLLHGDTL